MPCYWTWLGRGHEVAFGEAITKWFWRDKIKTVKLRPTIMWLKSCLFKMQHDTWLYLPARSFWSPWLSFFKTGPHRSCLTLAPFISLGEERAAIVANLHSYGKVILTFMSVEWMNTVFYSFKAHVAFYFPDHSSIRRGHSKKPNEHRCNWVITLYLF